MDNTVSSRSRQRRAKALSLAILVSMLSGLAPLSSQADGHDVVVTATVENCSVSISTAGTVDLGSPTLDESGEPPLYVFNTATSITPAPLTVNWATSGLTDCAGSLHAEHNGISKGGSPVADAWISLSDDGFAPAGMDQSINTGSSQSVAASATSGGGDSSDFDVKMMVSSSEGAGTYTTTLSFTVVLD